jgi:hypothetical protein
MNDDLFLMHDDSTAVESRAAWAAFDWQST